MTRSIAAPLLILLALLMTVPARAVDGGASGGEGSGGDGGRETSSGGYDPQYATAMEAVKAGRYADAVPLLEQVVIRNPRHADAHNNLAFSHRKLGDTATAMTLYAKALEIDPRHLGALEYQGELFLQIGEPQRAEANLRLLERLCGTCEQQEDLAEAIQTYAAKPKS